MTANLHGSVQTTSKWTYSAWAKVSAHHDVTRKQSHLHVAHL